jgi:hypothetical protein
VIDLASLVQTPNPHDHPQNKMWVDERIWGHRLWDSQSPWLLFLEFLNIAEACHREGQLLDEHGCYYPLHFRPYKRMFLRNILFNSETMALIAEKHRDNASAWSHWLKWMEDNAKAVPVRDFSYLRRRFHSFHEFARLVAMLRASAVESETNRRWSSRFIFPFGPNALYEDLNVTPSGAVSREYINFGLTGELLYKMLCRSAAAPKLREHLGELLNRETDWNKLLDLLQPDVKEDLETRGNSYLPHRQHWTFDRLGEDWLAICDLQLPGLDCYQYLVVLGALHVLLYQLNVALEWIGDDRKAHMICELVAPKKTLVRELSSANYQENNVLPLRAVETEIKRIQESEEWRRATGEAGAFAKCRQILLERVRWPSDPEDYQGPTDPDVLIAELRRQTIARHRQHVGNVHRNYGRDVGLVSKRATNKLRYAPNDLLLKSLILANVNVRSEYHEFLGRLFQRYGLLFGEREAAAVLDREDADNKAFQANSERLQQRLSSLGMLRRLSDACAYVRNPFSRRPQ